VKRTLGVCYYPEHWDESVWAEDARRMAELGLPGSASVIRRGRARTLRRAA
jgi:hypothetical protein